MQPGFYPKNTMMLGKTLLRLGRHEEARKSVFGHSTPLPHLPSPSFSHRFRPIYVELLCFVSARQFQACLALPAANADDRAAHAEAQQLLAKC